MTYPQPRYHGTTGERSRIFDRTEWLEATPATSCGERDAFFAEHDNHWLSTPFAVTAPGSLRPGVSPPPR